MDSRYQKTVLLYANPHTDIKVFEGVDLRTQNPVAIKEVVTYDPNSANQLLRESWVQSSINHPNICKLYGQYFFKEDDKFTCGIVMELLPSDLQKEIDEHRIRGERMEEAKLWTYLEQLISALATAQEKVSSSQCICHRDIKPLNLFVNLSGVIKVGDLGAAKTHVRLSHLQTLQGTPAYLSPKVRRQLLENRSNGTNEKVRHNPYKSDVFSLGITCICAALWDVPNELTELERLQEKIDKVVKRLPVYSRRLKDLISLMVIVEEDQRPDFLSLRRSSLVSQNPAPPLSDDSQAIMPGFCITCRGLSALDELIPLPCNAQHFFCTANCFKSFISKATRAYTQSLEQVRCPFCSGRIAETLVEEVFGGEYPPLPEGLERCTYCKSAIQPLDICRCTHRFCLNCLKTLKKVHGRIPKACPEDQIAFDPENIKKHRAICKIF